MLYKSFTIATIALMFQITVFQQPTLAKFNVVRKCQVITTESKDDQPKPPVLTALAVQKNGQRFATAGDDHLIRVWSIDGKLQKEIEGHTDWIRCMQISTADNTLITAGDDRTVRFWNMETGKQIVKLGPYKHSVYSVALSPNSKLIAVAGFCEKVKIYRTANRQLLYELKGTGKDVRSVKFSPDGSLIAAGGRKGVLTVWKVSDGSVVHQWNAHRRRIRCVAFSPDGKSLVSSGEDRQIIQWNLADGKMTKKIVCRTAKILTLRFLSNNTIVAAGSDNAIHQWNLTTGSHDSSFLGHTGSVTAIDFDAKQTLMFSISYDTTIRIWQLTQEIDAGSTTRRERNGSTNQ